MGQDYEYGRTKCNFVPPLFQIPTMESAPSFLIAITNEHGSRPFYLERTLASPNCITKCSEGTEDIPQIISIS